MKKKIFVLDTSVYLSNSNAIYSFAKNDIYVPIKVLEEIDKHKKRQDAVGANARQVIRVFDYLRAKGSLVEGVRLEKGKGLIRTISSKTLELPNDLDKEIADNKIISCALSLTKDNPEAQVILVSCDLNMRVIANSIGIMAQEFAFEHAVETEDELYTGTKDLVVEDEMIEKLYSGADTLLDEKIQDTLFPNQFLTLKSNKFDKKTAIVRYLDEDEPIKLLKDRKVFGISARNLEQKFCVDLLLDPNVKVVTLAGLAGSGKSLLCLAAGLHQTIGSHAKDEKLYKKIIIMKPTISVGEEIGFLPGTIEEKLLPWLKPIKDSLSYLFGEDKQMMEQYMERGTIEIEAISHVRGRSISNAYIFIEEAQNLSKHEIKTIMTRVGEGSKIVLTGDPKQIDNLFVDEMSNGLTHLIEKFKTLELAGHVTLKHGERSDVATAAAKML